MKIEMTPKIEMNLEDDDEAMMIIMTMNHGGAASTEMKESQLIWVVAIQESADTAIAIYLRHHQVHPQEEK